MFCWHHKYNLGDEHSFENLDDCLEEITEENNVIWPLYMFEHSGISLSITPYACSWDSCQVGVVCISKDDIPRPVIGESWRAAAMHIIRADVEEYSAYLGGEVFGYYLYQGMNAEGEPLLQTAPQLTDRCEPDYPRSSDDFGVSEWEIYDSCWGYFGHDYAKETILNEMPDYLRHYFEEEGIDVPGIVNVWVPAKNPPVEEKEVVPVRLRGGELPEEDE